ncbi:hypothetical protein PPL_02042 [Heterostelium album PN500]|uniref:RRM domain-containing protein n=1 Tax=Heterostelium pallidum (strain ATCC 26659 / Pp 5 / PN500) TaxID=670386 RepID=D3B172_HETP5|nr:hypothetical protein PPL_02042 [Heterostelium album PN500]EFA85046.1 hypothetical protein PPL_02042 [Heterostelium album PN500]|eukprot:XP_020437156.1 hypothetical protein PPL_02042 [Heterostelium album PN500]
MEGKVNNSNCSQGMNQQQQHQQPQQQQQLQQQPQQQQQQQPRAVDQTTSYTPVVLSKEESQDNQLPIDTTNNEDPTTPEIIELNYNDINNNNNNNNDNDNDNDNDDNYDSTTETDIMMDPNKKSGKIFVGGLTKSTSSVQFLLIYILLSSYYSNTTDKLKKYFSEFGEVQDSLVIKSNEKTVKSRGFGFVTFKHPDVIDKILTIEHVIDGKQESVHNYVLNEQKHVIAGKKVDVRLADSKKSKTSTTTTPTNPLKSSTSSLSGSSSSILTSPLQQTFISTLTSPTPPSSQSSSTSTSSNFSSGSSNNNNSNNNSNSNNNNNNTSTQTLSSSTNNSSHMNNNNQSINNNSNSNSNTVNTSTTTNFHSTPTQQHQNVHSQSRQSAQANQSASLSPPYTLQPILSPPHHIPMDSTNTNQYIGLYPNQNPELYYYHDSRSPTGNIYQPLSNHIMMVPFVYPPHPYYATPPPQNQYHSSKYNTQQQHYQLSYSPNIYANRFYGQPTPRYYYTGYGYADELTANDPSQQLQTTPIPQQQQQQQPSPHHQHQKPNNSIHQSISQKSPLLPPVSPKKPHSPKTQIANNHNHSRQEKEAILSSPSSNSTSSPISSPSPISTPIKHSPHKPRANNNNNITTTNNNNNKHQSSPTSNLSDSNDSFRKASD